MSKQNTYDMHLKCYTCGHQWFHVTTKGDRLYDAKEIGWSAIGPDVGLMENGDLVKNYGRIVCPHCHAFSDITNITMQWAPPNGYGNDKVEAEEDNPDVMNKILLEKEEARQKVIDMEKKKK